LNIGQVVTRVSGGVWWAGARKRAVLLGAAQRKSSWPRRERVEQIDRTLEHFDYLKQEISLQRLEAVFPHLLTLMNKIRTLKSNRVAEEKSTLSLLNGLSALYKQPAGKRIVKKFYELNPKFETDLANLTIQAEQEKSPMLPDVRAAVKKFYPLYVAAKESSELRAKKKIHACQFDELELNSTTEAYRRFPSGYGRGSLERT